MVTMNIGEKLSKDQWFAHNTLTFVFQHLDLKELLNASKVCPMWEIIINEHFLENLFIPTCVKHIENVILEHGKNISCLQLVDTHQIVLEMSVFKAISCAQNFNVINCHPKLVTHLAGQQYDFPLENTFIKKIPNLSGLRLYTDRMIFLENPNKAEFNSSTFYWRSLLRTKYLTNLELGFHIPNDFGIKVLRFLTHLETLKLHMYSGVDENIFKSIKSLGNLRELIILKVYVNEDLKTFLPKLNTVQKITLMIRAPCDTSYYYLLTSVLKLRSLKHFIWVVNDVTVSNVFFGQNCQTLLKLKNTLFDEKDIETCLRDLFPRIKISFLMADSQYYPKLQKKFEKCFGCIEENLKVPSGMNIDIEDDLDETPKTYNSTYDIEEVLLPDKTTKNLDPHDVPRSFY